MLVFPSEINIAPAIVAEDISLKVLEEMLSHMLAGEYSYIPK
jgi:hypothetical protein